MVSARVLLEGVWYSLEQCGFLLRDAVTLYNHQGRVTAVGLAMLAREEMGKARILLALWRNVVDKGPSLPPKPPRAAGGAGRRRRSRRSSPYARGARGLTAPSRSQPLKPDDLHRAEPDRAPAHPVLGDVPERLKPHADGRDSEHIGLERDERSDDHEDELPSRARSTTPGLPGLRRADRRRRRGGWRQVRPGAGSPPRPMRSRPATPDLGPH
jgi:hypothetical protein